MTVVSEQCRSASLEAVGDPIGRFYVWSRGDVLPVLPALPGLTIERTNADRLIAAFPGLDAWKACEREEQGCRGYLALVDGDAAALGWSAAGTASIGELGLAFTIPSGERYLWDFLTLPAFRGRGIYPRLLQAIFAFETEVERFWIGHDFPNDASARGIVKAGFGEVGWAFHVRGGGIGLAPTALSARATAAATLLGVPLLEHVRVPHG